jgi:hypothetical protein
LAALERELQERLSLLGPEQQRQVLEYARALSDAPLRGVPGHALLRFTGSISEKDLDLIARAIEEGCEGVDAVGL